MPRARAAAADADAAGKAGGAKQAEAAGASPAVAVFSRDGSVVYVGQGRGILTAVDAASMRLLDVVKVRTGASWGALGVRAGAL